LAEAGSGSIFDNESQIVRGMDKYTWKEEYNTGVNFIDEQHKYFFNIIASLKRSIDEGICRESASNIFFSLVHYAEHFLIQEEIYFKEANFPGIQEHKNLHAGFIQRIIQFQQDYEKDITHTCQSLLPYLDEWFDNHILKYDKEAIDYLKEKGL
jgi:hemerythrin-like metal-binding protein